MFRLFFSAFFLPLTGFVWSPAIEIRDGATAAALGIYTRT